jgi:hypothetical protein
MADDFAGNAAEEKLLFAGPPAASDDDGAVSGAIELHEDALRDGGAMAPGQPNLDGMFGEACGDQLPPAVRQNQ